MTPSCAVMLHLLCFQRLLLVVVPPEWWGFLELPGMGVGFQVDAGYRLETLPGLRRRLARGDLGQRLAPWVRLLLAGGLH